MLKWQVVDKNTIDSTVENTIDSNVQSAFFYHKESKNTIETVKSTKNLGISTGIIYLLMYVYIYVSAYTNMKTNGVELSYVTTTSESYQHCEKKLTIVFLIVFLALLQALFNKQNFYKDSRSISVVAINYVIIMCWLLFFYIVPSNFDQITKQKNSNVYHFVLAFIVLVSVMYNSFTISNL